jgi:hypothetical protein
MLQNPETRRKLAVLAMFLGVVFIISVIWSVLTGATEWWTLILILPAAVIMRRMSGMMRPPAGRARERGDRAGNPDHTSSPGPASERIDRE